MQRYFFDVWQDEEHHPDTDGEEFRSPDAAKIGSRVNGTDNGRLSRARPRMRYRRTYS